MEKFLIKCIYGHYQSNLLHCILRSPSKRAFKYIKYTFLSCYLFNKFAPTSLNWIGASANISSANKLSVTQIMHQNCK